jgi:hypothetical protein
MGRRWVPETERDWPADRRSENKFDLDFGNRLTFRRNISLPCKILGFHGGDYEECRLLGYKNPVRTS